MCCGKATLALVVLTRVSWHHGRHEINRKIYPPATAGGTDLTVPVDRNLDRLFRIQVSRFAIGAEQ